MTEENEVLKELNIDGPPSKEATLAERILWVRDRVTTLGKDSNVSTGGHGSYRAISHDKVTAFIRPKMVQAGIFHYIVAVDSTDSETGSSTAAGKKIVQHQGKFVVRFLNMHDRADFIDVPQYAYADDFGDNCQRKINVSHISSRLFLSIRIIRAGRSGNCPGVRARSATHPRVCSCFHRPGSPHA